MRVYEGTPRRGYEDVLRSLGRILDLEGVREVLFVEVDDGFIVRGQVVSQVV